MLSKSLRILQRRKGHRATSDDVLLAWACIDAKPDALHYLDLGSGKGTVALLVLDRLQHCSAVGLEAFEQSHLLAHRNARLNGLQSRYTPQLQDLRDWHPESASFDLIGGAPPFMPVGSGVLPRDPQRASGRFELRGGVEAYAQAAARGLTADGVAVLLMDGHGRTRGLAALQAADLHPFHLLAIGPRPDTPPTYWIFKASRNALPVTESRMDMREIDGQSWSKDYRKVRRVLNLP